LKIEIKDAILEMLSDDATVADLCHTAEDFAWVFDYVKNNADNSKKQIRTNFVLRNSSDLFLLVTRTGI